MRLCNCLSKITNSASTEVYTLSLHDALPISAFGDRLARLARRNAPHRRRDDDHRIDAGDRKSTRLNSSHQIISYAVFCLKKKHTYHQYGTQPPSDYETEHLPRSYCDNPSAHA